MTDTQLALLLTALVVFSGACLTLVYAKFFGKPHRPLLLKALAQGGVIGAIATFGVSRIPSATQNVVLYAVAFFGMSIGAAFPALVRLSSIARRNGKDRGGGQLN